MSPPGVSHTAGSPPRDRGTGVWLAVGASWLLIVALFHDNFLSMFGQWVGSEKFQHSYLVLPGALFLAWQRRHELAHASLRPSWLGLAALLCASVFWLLGRLAGLQIFEQLAAAAMPGLALWAIAGTSAARTLLWPLAFLLWLVPVGDELIPALMNWTADFAVAAVKASGVPIYRDGLRLSIPSGDFRVLEACSGVRYLLASTAMGFFCAGAFFTGRWRRLACIIAFILVPLLANGLRAYLIVMFGHFSRMRWLEYHVAFGETFFAAVCFFSCLVVARNIEDRPRLVPPSTRTVAALTSFILSSGLALLAAGIGPLLAPPVNAALQARPLGAAPRLPDQVEGWKRLNTEQGEWQPQYQNALESEWAVYERNGQRVEAHVFVYGHQTQNAELVNAKNRDFNSSRWTIIHQRNGSADGGPVYRQTELRNSAGRKWLLRRWYWLGGRALNGRAEAKLQELAAIFSPTGARAAAVILGLPFEGEPITGQTAMTDFMAALCRADGKDQQPSVCGR
jgi:exosortase A